MLAENIKNARKNKGLTQEELAIRLNVVRQTVGKWEKGLSVPDADLLQKMADIFEIEVSTLLGSVIEANGESNAVAEQLARLNEQLAVRNKSHRKLWISIGIALLAVIFAVAVFLFVRWIVGFTEKPPYADPIDFEAMGDNGYVCVTDFENDSPYIHYRDIILLNETNEYTIRSSTSNGFDFYFAESNYEDADASIFYPRYMCYVKYNGELPDNADMTIKYVYNEGNSWETSGEAKSEILLLTGTLIKMPQEIVISFQESGDKTDSEVILSVSFKLYSFE